MKQIQLPKDIRSHVRKKVLFRLLKFLVLAAISLFLIMILHDRLMEKCHIVIYMMIQLFIFVLPFWITEVPFKLLDKSWCGTVKAVDIKEETGTFTIGTRVFPYTNHIFILTVETESGKTFKAKAKEYGFNRYKGVKVPHEGNIQHHMNDYGEGDIIYHFYGLSELFVIGKNRPMNTNCVVCGSENPRNSTHCYHCGHTLLHTLFENTTFFGEGESS